MGEGEILTAQVRISAAWIPATAAVGPRGCWLCLRAVSQPAPPVASRCWGRCYHHHRDHHDGDPSSPPFAHSGSGCPSGRGTWVSLRGSSMGSGPLASASSLEGCHHQFPAESGCKAWMQSPAVAPGTRSQQEPLLGLRQQIWFVTQCCSKSVSQPATPTQQQHCCRLKLKPQCYYW